MPLDCGTNPLPPPLPPHPECSTGSACRPNQCRWSRPLPLLSFPCYAFSWLVLLCTASSAFHSLSLSTVNQPSHLICHRTPHAFIRSNARCRTSGNSARPHPLQRALSNLRKLRTPSSAPTPVVEPPEGIFATSQF